MAMIKVFSSIGVKELQCFDTLIDVPYLVPDQEAEEEQPKDNNPFE